MNKMNHDFHQEILREIHRQTDPYYRIIRDAKFRSQETIIIEDGPLIKRKYPDDTQKLIDDCNKKIYKIIEFYKLKYPSKFDYL